MLIALDTAWCIAAYHCCTTRWSTAVTGNACCVQVFYVVDKVSSFWWRGGVGYITKDMIKQHMPPPSDNSLILVRAAYLRKSELSCA